LGCLAYCVFQSFQQASLSCRSLLMRHALCVPHVQASASGREALEEQAALLGKALEDSRGRIQSLQVKLNL
jgi:hypothetical protein